jgi:hypothetical protein
MQTLIATRPFPFWHRAFKTPPNPPWLTYEQSEKPLTCKTAIKHFQKSASLF